MWEGVFGECVRVCGVMRGCVDLCVCGRGVWRRVCEGVWSDVRLCEDVLSI